MGYDDWLVEPYERAAREGMIYEQALTYLRKEDYDGDPPHKAGGDCPRCGNIGILKESEDEQGVLYCDDCETDIDPTEQQTFDPVEIVNDMEADRFDPGDDY